MPAVENWLSHPLEIIQKLLTSSTNNDDHTDKVLKYFDSQVNTSKLIEQIPSLNDTPIQNLSNNTLVRFRCMIQDMFDPEYFLGLVEANNSKTGQRTMRNGKFCDLLHCEPGCELDLDSSKNVTTERQTFYCIPVPGESSWVKSISSRNTGAPTLAVDPVNSASGSQKRKFDCVESAQPADMECDTNPDTSDDGAKHLKPEQSNGELKKSVKACGISANFPLPGETGPSCFVKVYRNSEDFKLNSVVEFVGVLSIDPLVAAVSSSAESDELELLGDDFAHVTPPSLVPRLHAVVARTLQHSNPLIVQDIASNLQHEAIQSLVSRAATVRTELISLLQFVLLGDRLAAEYLLCNLISNIYGRRDILALGKFTLNLTASPEQLSTHVYGLLKQLVTKSHLMPLTLDVMNTGKFQPQKDYVTNQLKTGLLQLSDHTLLLLDETALQPGQLNAEGVRNLTALSSLIKWQKLEFNFNFYHHEYLTDLDIVVLSEGKSLLPCDVVVPIQATQLLSSVEQAGDVTAAIGDQLLSDLRCYITLCQHLPYEVPEDLQQKIQAEFVDTRREDVNNMSVEDFHSLLALARLLSLSHCRSVLTEDIWRTAVQYEHERKARLSPNLN